MTYVVGTEPPIQVSLHEPTASPARYKARNFSHLILSRSVIRPANLNRTSQGHRSSIMGEDDSLDVVRVGINEVRATSYLIRDLRMLHNYFFFRALPYFKLWFTLVGKATFSVTRD